MHCHNSVYERKEKKGREGNGQCSSDIAIATLNGIYLKSKKEANF